MLVQRQHAGTVVVQLDRADVDAIEDALDEYSSLHPRPLGPGPGYGAHAASLAAEFRTVIREWHRAAQSPVEPTYQPTTTEGGTR